jgi:hypothetical protein
MILALDICDSFYYSPCFDCQFLLDQDGISFPSTCLFAHDGVEEENLTEHDEADDTSQAEDSQPHNRAVQSMIA